MTPAQKAALLQYIEWLDLDDISEIMETEDDARLVMDGLINVFKFLRAGGSIEL